MFSRRTLADKAISVMCDWGDRSRFRLNEVIVLINLFVSRLSISCFGLSNEKTTPETLFRNNFVPQVFKRGSIWRRDWDSNPGSPSGARTISNRMHSTALPSLQNRHCDFTSFMRFWQAFSALCPRKIVVMSNIDERRLSRRYFLISISLYFS